MRQDKTAFLTILFFCSMLIPTSALGYEWKAREGFQGWGFSNVMDIRTTAEGAVIYKQPGRDDFAISVPPGEVHDASFVRMHLRTMSVDSIAECTLLSGGRATVSMHQPLFSGRRWKDMVFDFSEAHIKVPVDMVVFSFKHCDSVELRDLTVAGPSVSEVFAPQGLRAYNVNALYPFTLSGYSLNLWFYVLIVVSGLGVAVFFSVKRKKGAFALAGLIYLACYVTLDMREVYEEIDIMKTTCEDYLSAPPGEKRFHWNDYIVGFSDLIRHTARPEDGPVHFFGDNSRYLYMRYLLYPVRLIQHQDKLGKVNVFYESDDVFLDGNKLVAGGQVLFEGGSGVAYSPHSFLYLTP